MSTAILSAALRRALARTGLQHPQLAVLDGEFQVLHVAVMVFEPVEDGDQLGKGIRHQLFQRRPVGCRPRCGSFLGDRLRGADAGHHVLALRVDEKLAVEFLCAGRWIAGERHTGGGLVAELPNTMACTLTAVPQESGMSWSLR
jgi:hypothetical protein